MKYYYLIINEGVSNGLIQSQVLNPIEYNSLQDEVGVISIEKPGWKRIDTSINLITIPFGVPYKLFLFNALAFVLVPVLAFLYAVVLSIITDRNDILIARSYFPGIVLLNLKRIRGNKYKFDPRSLFIHESVTKGKIKPDSRLFKQWIRWEKAILREAEQVIVVAKKQGEYYQNTVAQPLSLINIPCYSSGPTTFKSSRTELLPFKEEDVVLVYYGSLDDGWNNKDIYSGIFTQAIVQGYKVCILSQNYKELQNDDRFSGRDIFIVDTKRNRNHSEFLQVCDYGVVVMPKTSDWETRLSVKFVEYSSNGLGVLVGEFVGEAVRISTKYFADYNYVLCSNLLPTRLRTLLDSDRDVIKRQAERLFSLSNFTQLVQ